MRTISLIGSRVAAAPAVLRGAMWMVVASVVFAVLSGLVRQVTVLGAHPFEIIFFRNLFGLMAMAPWFYRVGFAGLKTQRIGLFVGRGLFSLVGMTCWFSAIALVPLAEVVALSYTAPLFTTVAAIFLLGEQVGLRRWGAILIGLAGAAIILRPGMIELSMGSVLAIAAAGTMACGVVLVKLLSRTESTPAIVAWQQIVVLPGSAVLAFFVWKTPSLELLGWMVLLGVVGTLGHLAVTKAFSLADTTAIMPFDFFRLIFTAIVGLVFFAEQPEIYLWIGAGVIFVSSIYVARREAQLARSGEREVKLAGIKTRAEALGGQG